ncbi:hypothetical protein BDV93DRAFT_525807 [Ceratobasidium sp. AG-I]|nr:hypothetical protein BDV93DRAFT_525807 [Ceratobasidium sp. AG-I]
MQDGIHIHDKVSTSTADSSTYSRDDYNLLRAWRHLIYKTTWHETWRERTTPQDHRPRTHIMVRRV